MGNEFFYCFQCGIRLRGSDFDGSRARLQGDRTYCAGCLGLPVPSARESTKVVRRQVPARIRSTTRVRKPRRAALLIGGSLIAAAGLFAFTGLASTPPPAAPSVVVALPAMVPPPVVPVPDPPRPPAPPNLDALKDRATGAVDPEDGDAVLQAIRDAAALAPERAAEIRSWESDFRARYEALADAHHGPLEEAATALADEKRYDDALAHLRTFPKGLRESRAWSNLEALRRHIEAKAAAR